MKFKEIEATANVVWSPQSFYPIMLAAGSAAQHVDASFSSNASLELYALNLNDPGYEMEQKVSIHSEDKFQKLVWSTGGVLVGGCDGGLLKFYNVNNMLNTKDALISSNTKHTGSVSALDLNPFQNNLFSSGASDSEIFIWDLNNTSTPMAPGNKSQPNEHVQALAWNRQVQHILASSFSTRCIVWDLRKNEPIIKLCDGQARIRWKSATWHPSVATQLCLASEEDSTPVIQLWDLRLATSPLLTLENHQKGVLALSWCQQDADLLLSASKDGRILCWNPNNNMPGGEVLSEICSTGQWMYDVQWCPRNPNLVVACNNDGRVGVYSINGGTHLQPVATSNKIMDSFPGMESLHQAPVPSMAEIHTSPQILPRPPHWMKRPCKASFGFGGKLITFANQTQTGIVGAQNGTAPQREIFISQVITEPELVTKAHTLQEIMNLSGNEGSALLLAEYCSRKGDQINDQHEKYIWHFLKANFLENPRNEMLNLLGFKPDDISNKLNSHFIKTSNKQQTHIESQMDNITDRFSGLSRSESSETEAEPSTDTSTDISGVDAVAAFDNIAQANKANNEVISKLPIQPFVIPMGDDPEALICQALLSGNIEIAVELCMDAGKTADALVIASTGGNDLLNRTQWRYLSRRTGAVSSLSSALLSGNWTEFTVGVASNSWKAALAAALTHCSPNELYTVCETLGKKLDKEIDKGLYRDAVICYLCSASVDELVLRWQNELNEMGNDSKSLSHIAELVLVTRLAAIQRGRSVQDAKSLTNFLANYAMRLASQGYFEGALTCLSGFHDQNLIYRIQCAMGYASPYSKNFDQSAKYNKQINQQSVPSQNQFSATNRVRTSSYKSAVQDPWTSPQTNYMPNNIPPYNTISEPVVPSQPPGIIPQQSPLPPQGIQPPPRPSSASSHGGLANRNKYVRDPSVQSGPSIYQPPPVDTQPSFGSRPGFGQSAIPSAPSTFNSQTLNPTVNPIQSPYPTVFNTAHNYNNIPSNPPILQPNSAPIANFANNLVPNMPPVAPMQMNTINNNLSYPPTSMNNAEVANGNDSQYYLKAEIATEAMPNAYSQSPSGWNDPPVLSSKKSQPKQEYVPTPPVTHPLYGAAQPQHVPLTGPLPHQGDSVNQHPPVYGNTLPNPPPTSAMIPNQAQSLQSEIIQAPPMPIQKPPIPEQHIHLQTVFDALRAQCAQSISNPQVKRKLDEVQKKLEILYDLLRENKLSDNAINTLHRVVQMVQSGDYGNSLSTLTSLASGPDFATVASFLPSLKIMIQTANNSQIFLR